MKPLQHLQQLIERLHDIDTGLDVGAFAVGDQLHPHLPGARPELPEQLLVAEMGDTVDVALYVAGHVLERLHRENPQAALHSGNLDSFCVATEGVSHFCLLAWKGMGGERVSALELELQAEVDKFLVAWLLLRHQGYRLHETGGLLLTSLFERIHWRESLSEREIERYQTANRAAQRYCLGLVQRHARPGDVQRLLRSARNFYRVGLAEKMRLAGAI